MPKGILFIGDPHITSIAPTRRMDKFSETVISKLKQSAEIAMGRDLVPIVLGDLFHRSRENDIELLYNLTDVLQSFPYTPLVLGGNHDRLSLSFAKKDALAFLGKAKVVRVMNEPGHRVYLDIRGHKVAVVPVPHGHPIPSALEKEPDVLVNIMVTHHDLAFESAYPGAERLEEVENCPLAVNGHMHATYKPVKKGQTTWINPGNISRLSVDTLEHVPSVWEWSVDSVESLVQHKLDFVKDVFDLTGRRVAADTQVTGDDLKEADKVITEALSSSLFADLLKAEESLDAGRTEDGAILREDLEELLEEKQISATAKVVIADLLTRVTDK